MGIFLDRCCVDRYICGVIEPRSSSTQMGKSHSKLSPEQLADLQKNTYCKCPPLLLPASHRRSSRQEGATAMVCTLLSILCMHTHHICPTGTRDFSRTVRRASWTRQSLAEYTSSSFPLGIPANSPTTSSMSLMRTRTAPLISRSSSALSASRAEVA